MWPWTSLSNAVAVLKAAWRPLLLVATAIVCFGLGWRQHGLEDASDLAQTLARAAAQRQKQDDEARKREAADTARLEGVRRTAADNIRKVQAHATNPDRRSHVPADLLLELNAAAGHDPAPR